MPPDVSMATVPPLLEVTDLRVAFHTERGILQAVDGVSFRVEAEEIVGVVGESGSGKSVCLMAVLGLISGPYTHIEGSVRLMGRELVGLPNRELRKIRGRDMAVIFQDPMTAMTPVYTVGQQIVEQIRVHQPLSRKAAKARAIDLLDAVGIGAPAKAADRYPHELSGGMRQRAMIAMALSCNPRLLLADEPTTALDVTVQAQILDLILRLRSEFKSAVILITHDMGVIAEAADQVMVMYAGRVVERGSKNQLFANPLHPYTWGLLASIPPLDGERVHRLPSIGGLPPSLLDLPAGCAFSPRCRDVSARCQGERPVLDRHGDHARACFLPLESVAAQRRAGLAASLQPAEAFSE
ncbi:MAG: ABC transporter ATP-binding protein [Azospirillaceae bacterium]|nr:ABC transporter ATP-binding protein [Azospirillaceae bacterium]